MILICAIGKTLCRQSDFTPLADFGTNRAALRALIRLYGGRPGPGSDTETDLQTERKLQQLLANTSPA